MILTGDGYSTITLPEHWKSPQAIPTAISGRLPRAFRRIRSQKAFAWSLVLHKPDPADNRAANQMGFVYWSRGGSILVRPGKDLPSGGKVLPPGGKFLPPGGKFLPPGGKNLPPDRCAQLSHLVLWQESTEPIPARIRRRGRSRDDEGRAAHTRGEARPRTASGPKSSGQAAIGAGT